MEDYNFHDLSASCCACMSLQGCEVLSPPVHEKSSPSHFVNESVLVLFQRMHGRIAQEWREACMLTANPAKNRFRNSVTPVRGMSGPVVQWSRPVFMLLIPSVCAYNQQERSERNEWSSGPVVQTSFHVAHFVVFVHNTSANAVRGMSGPVVQWSRPTFMLLISASLCIPSYTY